jgi:putative intracellular protease/amidase
LAKKTGTNESILNGVEATGFSNAEEAQTPYNDFVNTLPYSLEDKMVSLGAKFVKAQEPWGVKIAWDGGVLTGTSQYLRY